MHTQLCLENSGKSYLVIGDLSCSKFINVFSFNKYIGYWKSAEK